LEENQNGRFRHRKTNFAAVSNSALQDENLSLKAKGLYALIQSYINIPNYDLRKWKLIQSCKEGKKAFDTAWMELKKAGYLKQYRIPSGDKGQFIYEYELLDAADLLTPSMVNLNRSGETIKQVENQAGDEESDHTPQNGVYGQNQENLSDHTPHLAPYAQSTVCSEDAMLNGGGNNNNQSNKNKFNNTQSIYQKEGQIDEIRNRLNEQIEYDYFEENYPEDITGVETIVGCMADMLSSPTTKISGIVQSREALKAYIDRVDSCTLREFLQDMKGKDMSGVKNVNAYWRSSFINYLRAQELLKLQI